MEASSGLSWNTKWLESAAFIGTNSIKNISFLVVYSFIAKGYGKAFKAC